MKKRRKKINLGRMGMRKQRERERASNTRQKAKKTLF